MRIRSRYVNRRQPVTPAVSPTKAEPPPLQQQIDLLIDDGQAEATAQNTFTAIALGMFKAAEFTTMWREKAALLFPQVQTIIADTYAFIDVLSSLEDALIDGGIDRGASLLDEATEKEIAALAAYRLLMLYSRSIFEADDYQAVRAFLLQPEEAERLGKARGKDKTSDVIKKLYDLQKRGSSELNDMLRDSQKTGPAPVAAEKRPVGYRHVPRPNHITPKPKPTPSE